MPIGEEPQDYLLNNPMPDAIRVSLIVTRILEELGVPYLIGGSVASIIHGEPRLTNDIDLVADIREEQVPQLVAALEADFYVDDWAIRRAILERKSFNILYLETMFKVDIFIPRGDEWSREQMRSREGKKLVEGDDSTLKRQLTKPALILRRHRRQIPRAIERSGLSLNREFLQAGLGVFVHDHADQRFSTCEVMTMPYSVFRVVALSSLILTTCFLFYTPAQGQTYSVNGAQIEVSILPEKSVIMLGEPIHLSFIVRNLSGTDLCFSEGGDYRNRLGRPESYDVRAVRSDGKQVPKPEILIGMGGVIGGVKVPAGASATIQLFLPHWAPFEETGIYTITCKRTLGFLDLDAEGLRSNGISVPVQTSVQIEVVGSNHEKMGDIIEKLGAEMLGEDEEKAERASRSLDYINDERTVPYLVKAIDSDTNSLVLSSLRSLSKYSTDLAIEGIKKVMKASPKEMRRASNRQSAISMAESVRLSAAIALKDSKHPDAFSLLLSMRKDSYWGVRLNVVHALGGLGTPEAIEILREMSKDENEVLSREAIRYLSSKEKN